MYKVGDKVICIRPKNIDTPNLSYGITPGGAGWKFGLVFTIREVEPFGNTSILWGLEMACGVFADYVKPYIDSKETAKDYNKRCFELST